MFLYYYVHVQGPFEQVELQVLRMLPGLRGWANDAYREGEHLYTRLCTPKGRLAKTVELTVAEPARGATETWIPIEWEATGTPSLFPRMQADLVVAAVGLELAQIALRGAYQVPLGKVGVAINRTFLHRVAEASVKSFLDRIATAATERSAVVEGSVG